VQLALENAAAPRKGALQKMLAEQGCAGERFSVTASRQAPAGGFSVTWLAY
jgi:hypothetical protein